ncbi:MAG: hypothetical protein II739_06120 [Clostridia bacterium]|nr:hypothetical protein [Clostridia bacterium]
MLVLFVLAAVLLTVCFVNRPLLAEKPTYVLESASEVAFDGDGGLLVIDNGKKTLLHIDADGNLQKRVDGGSDDAPFCYASHAVRDGNGNVYVADIVYGERGNLLDRERVIRLDKSAATVLRDFDYTGLKTDKIPLQYGHILELQPTENGVYYLYDATDEIELHKLGADGADELVGKVPAAGVKNDAA